MYMWLQNPANMKKKRSREFRPLRESTLRTARAWRLKETAMTLWEYARRGWAERAWMLDAIIGPLGVGRRM